MEYILIVVALQGQPFAPEARLPRAICAQHVPGQARAECFVVRGWSSKATCEAAAAPFNQQPDDVGRAYCFELPPPVLQTLPVPR
jgi:hypothetical protein